VPNEAGGDPKMTPVAEDYLKAIYKLQEVSGKVSTSALAERMGVTAPTVTSMIGRLAELGLLRYDRYRGVELTGAGARTALEVIRHHRLWELFLNQALQVPLSEVHAEAERLEHNLSDSLEERLDRSLGYPAYDPHGDPIPTREGELPHGRYPTLYELSPGACGRIQRVPDSDPALLRYLGELGLLPGATIEIREKAPFGGPLFLVVHPASGKAEEAPRVLGRELAERILVDVAEFPQSPV
jgi:DtxR family Mn-dependent transcriptional regulator